MNPRPLNYQSIAPKSRRMILEQSGEGAALIFPTPHPALMVGSIVCSLAMAAISTFALVITIRTATMMQVPVLSFVGFTAVFNYGFAVVIWGTVGGLEILWFRSAMRVRKRLSFDAAELCWEWPSWRGVRQRCWPLSNVIEARCKELRSIIPGVIAVEVRIRIRSKRWPVRFRASGYKVPLAKQFIGQLNEAVARVR